MPDPAGCRESRRAPEIGIDHVGRARLERVDDDLGKARHLEVSLGDFDSKSPRGAARVREPQADLSNGVVAQVTLLGSAGDGDGRRPERMSVAGVVDPLEESLAVLVGEHEEGDGDGALLSNERVREHGRAGAEGDDA